MFHVNESISTNSSIVVVYLLTQCNWLRLCTNGTNHCMGKSMFDGTFYQRSTYPCTLPRMHKIDTQKNGHHNMLVG